MAFTFGTRPFLLYFRISPNFLIWTSLQFKPYRDFSNNRNVRTQLEGKTTGKKTFFLSETRKETPVNKQEFY